MCCHGVFLCLFDIQQTRRPSKNTSKIFTKSPKSAAKRLIPNQE